MFTFCSPCLASAARPRSPSCSAASAEQDHFQYFSLLLYYIDILCQISFVRYPVVIIILIYTFFQSLQIEKMPFFTIIFSSPPTFKFFPCTLILYFFPLETIIFSPADFRKNIYRYCIIVCVYNLVEYSASGTVYQCNSILDWKSVTLVQTLINQLVQCSSSQRLLQKFLLSLIVPFVLYIIFFFRQSVFFPGNIILRSNNKNYSLVKVQFKDGVK